ncbi:MAG: ABC transporter permease [Actinomycetota bacterium]|nr:ABC transporter permease [Actinomycetota bacterium]
MNPALVRLELRRAVRNRRTLLFAAILPVFFFLAFSAGGQTGKLNGLAVAPYLMVSMATYGAMNALFTGGGVIAGERSIGWPRQLRVAGLRNRDYVATKVLVAYLTALPGVLAVFVVGATVKNVHLDAIQWMATGVTVLVTLLPIAALGVAIGYVARPQALQAVFGIGSALLALMGGLWVPANTFPGALQDIMKVLPTYWAADAGRRILQGSFLSAEGIAILVAWTIVLGTVAGYLFRRDSLRPNAAGAT